MIKRRHLDIPLHLWQQNPKPPSFVFSCLSDFCTLFISITTKPQAQLFSPLFFIFFFPEDQQPKVQWNSSFSFDLTRDRSHLLSQDIVYYPNPRDWVPPHLFHQDETLTLRPMQFHIHYLHFDFEVSMFIACYCKWNIEVHHFELWAFLSFFFFALYLLFDLIIWWQIVLVEKFIERAIYNEFICTYWFKICMGIV